jgi:dephospho-CoA kinase
MIKAGLTGNIGSGKSTVAGIFEVLGIPVYHADAEARRMLDDLQVQQEISRDFGQLAVTGGRVDRKLLANIVFNDPEALQKLNAIIHPRVRAHLMEWIAAHDTYPYVVQEAAILFESGFNTFFDKNIVVTCPEATAIERVMKRDGISEKEVRDRMRNQWPQAKKAKMADYLIRNDGSELVIPQVLAVHESLLSL